MIRDGVRKKINIHKTAWKAACQHAVKIIWIDHTHFRQTIPQVSGKNRTIMNVEHI